MKETNKTTKDVLGIDSLMGDVSLELQKQETILNVIMEMVEGSNFPVNTPEERKASSFEALRIMKTIENLVMTSIDQNRNISDSIKEVDTITDNMLNSNRDIKSAS